MRRESEARILWRSCLQCVMSHSTQFCAAKRRTCDVEELRVDGAALHERQQQAHGGGGQRGVVAAQDAEHRLPVHDRLAVQHVAHALRQLE